MVLSAIIFLSLLLLGALCVLTTGLLVYRLTPETRRKQCFPALMPWALKGLAVPLLLWMVMNLGVSWSLQPFMPQVQAAQNAGGDWFGPFLEVWGCGVFIVASYWMPLTLAWTLARESKGVEKEARANFQSLCLTCGIVMVLPALLFFALGGWMSFGLAASAILVPIAGWAPETLHARKRPPMYARAIARVKFGKYAEAEMEIIRELEKREDDFDGWLMLAELYANQFNDLAEAEQTILELCSHPKTSPSQLSIALHKLADWQMKLGGDPGAARRALQTICSRLPGTHLARMAQLRMNQLPATATELRQQREHRSIPLPALRDPLDQALRPVESKPDPDRAVELANACVENLNLNPNNIPAREKLARLLAEQLEQADRGIEQIMLLLGLPDQSDAKRAEWLALVAAWHLTYRKDADAGRKTLERLLQEFPQSPQALTARRRLQALETA